MSIGILFILPLLKSKDLVSILRQKSWESTVLTLNAIRDSHMGVRRQRLNRATLSRVSAPSEHSAGHGILGNRPFVS
jgi:hypothetical protein